MNKEILIGGLNIEMQEKIGSYVPVEIKYPEEDQGMTILHMQSTAFAIHPKFVFTNTGTYDRYIWFLGDEVITIASRERKEITFDTVAYNKSAVIRMAISDGTQIWVVEVFL